MSSLNPRYLAYCRSNDNTSEEQHEKDEEDWPGGRMCGFILFLKKHYKEYEAEINWNNIIKSEEYYTNFDKWLQAKYPDVCEQ